MLDSDSGQLWRYVITVPPAALTHIHSSPANISDLARGGLRVGTDGYPGISVPYMIVARLIRAYQILASTEMGKEARNARERESNGNWPLPVRSAAVPLATNHPAKSGRCFGCYAALTKSDEAMAGFRPMDGLVCLARQCTQSGRVETGWGKGGLLRTWPCHGDHWVTSNK